MIFCALVTALVVTAIVANLPLSMFVETETFAVCLGLSSSSTVSHFKKDDRNYFPRCVRSANKLFIAVSCVIHLRLILAEMWLYVEAVYARAS
jgi:hypothetical protein